MTSVPQIKVVVSDIDGTLVGESKQVSAFTRAEVARVAAQHRLAVLLVSGRMPSSIQAIQASLGIEGPFVAYDGALVIDKIEQEPLLSVRMPESVVEPLLEIASRRTVHLGIFESDAWVVDELDYWSLREVRGTRIWPIVNSTAKTLERWLVENRLPHKVMIRGESHAVEEAMSIVEPLLGSEIRTSQPRPTIVELVARNTGKVQAVSILLERVDASFEEVLAFGDGDNDSELLGRAGRGVAMADATAKSLEAANEMTLTCHEDGVGLTLRKYFPAYERADQVLMLDAGEPSGARGP